MFRYKLPNVVAAIIFGLLLSFYGCREEAEMVDYSLQPSLIGKAELGNTLEVALRREPPVGWEKMVRWYRDGVEIKDIRGVSYRLVSEDLGKQIKASIEYISDGESGQISYTDVTKSVEWAPSAPYFEGVLQIDSTIRLVVDLSFLSEWKHTITWYSYSDTDAETLLKSPLGDRYKITALDLGRRFRVKVVYEKDKVKKEIFSEYSPVIGFGQGRPVIEGLAVLDSTLTLKSQPSPEGWEQKVKWYRSTGVAYAEIEGASGTSYKITGSDGGAKLRAGVRYELTYTDGGKTNRYMTKELYSDPTNTVRFVYLNVPQIQGALEVDSVLEVSEVDLDGWDVSYEWQRGRGSDLKKYASIPGHSSQSYTLTHQDVGYQFRVRFVLTHDKNSLKEYFYTTVTSLVTWSRKDPVLLYGAKKEKDGSKKSLFDTVLHVSADPAPQNWEREIRWYRKSVGSGEELIQGGKLPKFDSYALAGEDIGSKVRAGVFYHYRGAKTQELYTDYTEVVSLSQAPPVKPDLQVVNNAKYEFGEVLEVGTDALTLPAGWSWEIRWLRVEPGVGNVVIADAVGKQYIIRYEDIGKSLLSEVRYVNGAARTLGTRTDQTVSIGKGIDLPSTKPVLSGDAMLGELLVGNNFDNPPGSGNWELKYRWYRNGLKDGGKDTLISGSDAHSYRLVALDVGNYIKVGQYFRRPNGAETPVVKSDGLGPVVLDISPPAKPVINGELKANHALSASLELPSQGWQQKVVWYRSRTKSGGYTEIAGSEGKTVYNIEATDMEGYIQAGVRYVKGILSTEETRSDAQGPVDVAPPKKPSIKGRFYVGSDIEAEVATPPVGWTLDAKWYRIGGVKPVEVGRGLTYKLQRSDVSYQLQVEIRYRKNDGSQQTPYVFSDKSLTVQYGKPNTPSSLFPEDRSKTNITRDQMLSWSKSTDIDGSNIVYDVYLGRSSKGNMTKVATVSTNFYKPSSYLNRNSVYYWKVIARDGDGYEAESVTHSFYTSRLLRKYFHDPGNRRGPSGRGNAPISSLYFYPPSNPKYLLSTLHGGVSKIFELDKFEVDKETSDMPNSPLRVPQNSNERYRNSSDLGRIAGRSPDEYTLAICEAIPKGEHSSYGANYLYWTRGSKYDRSSPITRQVALYAVRNDGTIGDPYATLSLPSGSNALSIAIDPKSNKYIAVGYESGTVAIYEYDGSSTLKERKSFRAKNVTLRIRRLRFSPDGDYLAAVEYPRSVALWNFREMQKDFTQDPVLIRKIKYAPSDYEKVSGAWTLDNLDDPRSKYPKHPNDPGGWIREVLHDYSHQAYSDIHFFEGRNKRMQLLTVGRYTDLFDAATGDFVRYINGIDNRSAHQFALSVLDHANDRIIYANNFVRLRTFTQDPGYADGFSYTKYVLSPYTSQRIQEFYTAIAMSPDGKLLVTGDGSGRVLVWDMEGL